MRFINSSFTDAGFNLAAEEYLLKQGTEDVFMLWQSAPSVIIGKHQRVETEVNRTMAEQNKIPVFRRFFRWRCRISRFGQHQSYVH